MRRTPPIVLGAGPAGTAAAIRLAQGGAEPVLLDRDSEVGDALCGGFLSWRTAKRLRRLGLDVAALGAQPVRRLALFTAGRTAEARLPGKAWGLSRHALDTAMRALAVEAGARLEIDRARHVEPGLIEGERQEWRSDAILLASGKHDVRGSPRPREDEDPALGLRVRLPHHGRLTTLIGDRIELHLFDGGYAGIVLQEGGSANVCLALRKSLLAEAGGDPKALLAQLSERYPFFGARMALSGGGLAVDSVGAVPYGWIARDTAPGLYRLGDQAAIIPSLAGEGMAIAVASGEAAAKAWLAGKDAVRFQREFAAKARRPVGMAKLVWTTGETDRGAAMLTGLTRVFPPLAGLAMRLTRI